MLSKANEARASQPKVAEVGQDELRKVLGGYRPAEKPPACMKVKIRALKALKEMV
jgi:hypothetical protein